MKGWSISQMTRMAQKMSFGNSPKFKEGERVRVYENEVERFAEIISWHYSNSEDAYYYCINLESRDINRRRFLKKESELHRI